MLASDAMESFESTADKALVGKMRSVQGELWALLEGWCEELVEQVCGH